MTQSPDVKLRLARRADADALLSMMASFNRLEGIPFRATRVRPALVRLLRDPALGLVIVAEGWRRSGLLGYAVATFNYDLEFAGPDAFITELFVRARQRGRGLGRLLLEEIVEHLRGAGARAVHLLVRPDNAGARSLYERAGFEVVPRLMMTRILPPTRKKV